MIARRAIRAASRRATASPRRRKDSGCWWRCGRTRGCFGCRAVLLEQVAGQTVTSRGRVVATGEMVRRRRGCLLRAARLPSRRTSLGRGRRGFDRASFVVESGIRSRRLFAVSGPGGLVPTRRARRSRRSGRVLDRGGSRGATGSPNEDLVATRFAGRNDKQDQEFKPMKKPIGVFVLNVLYKSVSPSLSAKRGASESGWLVIQCCAFAAGLCGDAATADRFARGSRQFYFPAKRTLYFFENGHRAVRVAETSSSASRMRSEVCPSQSGGW